MGKLDELLRAVGQRPEAEARAFVYQMPRRETLTPVESAVAHQVKARMLGVFEDFLYRAEGPRQRTIVALAAFEEAAATALAAITVEISHGTAVPMDSPACQAAALILRDHLGQLIANERSPLT